MLRRVRITGGIARSRRLTAPRGAETRPTAERVREALFSILGPPPEGARVLDLFAGAGTLGFEALSRGASSVLFVDERRAAVTAIRDNARRLGMEDASRIQCADVLRALPRIGETFDWVFVDPPYATELATRTLELLGEGRQVRDDSVVVVEHDRRRPTAAREGCLVKVDERRYGDTAISLYHREQL
jgi:16S rRNA (guanine966-N2)-methyltransferase